MGLNIEKIKSMMDAKGITRAQLAELCGVTQAFISYMMRGLKQPSVVILKRMSDVLGCTMDELVM